MEIEEGTLRRLVLADPRRRVAAGIILAIAAAWLFLGTPAAAEQNGPIIGLIAVACTRPARRLGPSYIAPKRRNLRCGPGGCGSPPRDVTGRKGLDRPL